ncbi:CPBP family glutamic-type intramembrane protease [Bacillus wiedmannii]|uniref:CPBP family glutamic-type intramembrane protease n=1 Tax=Bacillus wiedmannii TaxID=1890302 RepID=UPI0021CF7897|nr:CPBP family glutamic-type intramembrane protease [Bacillus wiedmannii]MCU5707720.1 CPBP family glutamic-type intramembrane protease [Bacillus wiedmannii]
MNSLYDRRPTSTLTVIIGIFLILIAYVGLVYASPPFSFTFIALAGFISLYLNYGTYGIKSAFSPLQKGAIKFILIGYIWNAVQSSLVAVVITYGFDFPVAANGATNIFVDNTAAQFIYNAIDIIFSLIGEECFVLIPSILAIYFLKKHRVNEKRSIIIVTIIGAFFFGLAHYSTYNGNLVQIFFVIGLARLPLNWVAFKANSLWASSITHILFDFTPFIAALLFSVLR